MLFLFTDEFCVFQLNSVFFVYCSLYSYLPFVISNNCYCGLINSYYLIVVFVYFLLSFSLFSYAEICNL